MIIEIEKGVPIPNSKKGAQRVYPFDQMEVGDSFSFPKGDWGRVTAAVQRYKIVNLKKKFSVFSVLSRCWRVA